jgi:hypothetical protein
MRRTFYTALTALAAGSVFAQSTVLFQTGFEKSEGYDPRYTLAFQNGWLGEGTGGNGLIEHLPELGQQAYIGYHPPTDLNDLTTIWRPVVAPIPAAAKIIRFSVVMQIVPSTAGGDDEFRWSVFNKTETRLLSLSFNTRTRQITYVPQDRVHRDTGYTFDFEGTYDLEIWLNLERNTWTALLNDRFIVNAETIATSAADLSFGDVDAVWAISNIQGVGNNYMVFDNYRVTAETGAAIPGYLEPLGPNAEGHFTFNVYGEKNRNYSVDVSADLREWFSLGTFSNTHGTFLFEDTTSKNYSSGFYRLRQVD